MKMAIRAACAGVTAKECKNAILGFHRRLEECVRNNGEEVRNK
jgi:hypothetical protein